MRLCPPTKYRLCPRGQFFRLFLTLQFGHFIGQFLATWAFRIRLPVPRRIMIGEGFVGLATAVADELAQLVAIVVEVNYAGGHAVRHTRMPLTPFSTTIRVVNLSGLARVIADPIWL